jgi:hypothetical protein
MTDEDRLAISVAFQPFKHPFWKTVGLYRANGEGKDVYTTDNYNLFTALYFRMFGALSFEKIDYNDFVAASKIKDGLYCRFPGRVTDISQDEIYGMSSTSSLLSMSVSDWGSDHWYSYNLVEPEKFTFDTFLGRFPCFTAYMKAAAGKFMWFWQVYWFFGFIASAWTNETETSGKLLAYLQIPVMQKTLVGKVAIPIWKWKMKRTYPNGLCEVCKIYFPAGHPFTVYAQKNWN